MFRASLFIALFALTSLNGQIAFTPAGGFYGAAGVQITMEAGVGERIFYTLDGSRPDAHSLTYEAGERVDFYQTTIIRAVAINAEGKAVATGGTTYLVGEPESELAVISIGIDSRRLFDPDHGWFVAGPRVNQAHPQMKGANFWSHKEYPGHLDLFEPDGSSIFHGQVGYRLFGGMSRMHPQKSLSVSWRKKYGHKELKYPVFGEEASSHFKYLVFRSGGSDWSRSHLRDVVMSDLLKNDSWQLDHQANRPARLYINGKYWGLYHLREKINRSFVADHNGYHRDSLDLLEHRGTVKAGNDRSWQETIQFFQEHWYFDNQTMAEARERIDVDNFMQLQIAQLYFDNRDAGGNIRYYRPWSPDRYGRQQWRWILYDLDYGFGLHDPEAYASNTLALHTEANGPAWPNPPWSTLLHRRLLTHPEYQSSFVNRSLDYLETDFQPEAVKQTILAHVAAVEAEMPRALARWKLKESTWQWHVERLLEFADKRPEYVREQLRAYFKGGEDRTLNLRQNAGGYIRVNENIYLRESEWNGRYFSAYPVSIRAVAEPGYRFVGWEGMEGRRSLQSIDLSKPGDYLFTAEFEENNHQLAGQIIITEVAAGKSGTWTELHNSGQESVNLRDWLLTWNGTKIRLPNTSLAGGAYLTLCGEAEKVRGDFLLTSEVAMSVEELKAMAKLPTAVGLYGPRGAFVDLANLPDVGGSAVALAANYLDNSAAENWMITEAALESPGRATAINTLAFHIRYNQLWERLAGAILLIVAGWYYLRWRYRQQPERHSDE